MQNLLLLVNLVAVVLSLAINLPAYGQRNPAPFSECYEQIGRAETEGRITNDKANSLRNELRTMQERDARLTKPGGHVREDSLWHGQIVHQVTAMTAEAVSDSRSNRTTPLSAPDAVP